MPEQAAFLLLGALLAAVTFMELVKCKIEGLGMELTGGWNLALVEHLG